MHIPKIARIICAVLLGFLFAFAGAGKIDGSEPNAGAVIHSGHTNYILAVAWSRDVALLKTMTWDYKKK